MNDTRKARQVRRGGSAVIAAACIGWGLAGVAWADGRRDAWSLEVFAGDWELDQAPGELTYGLRGGRHLGERFAIDGLIGRVDHGSGFHETFFEPSAVWYANPGDRAAFYLEAGPGLVLFGFDGTSGYATAHAGLGVRVRLSGRFHARLDARARQIFDPTDFLGWQGTASLGFSLGK